MLDQTGGLEVCVRVCGLFVSQRVMLLWNAESYLSTPDTERVLQPQIDRCRAHERVNNSLLSLRSKYTFYRSEENFSLKLTLALQLIQIIQIEVLTELKVELKLKLNNFKLFKNIFFKNKTKKCNKIRNINN